VTQHVIIRRAAGGSGAERHTLTQERWRVLFLLARLGGFREETEDLKNWSVAHDFAEALERGRRRLVFEADVVTRMAKSGLRVIGE
jgi:hypothetical protein